MSEKIGSENGVEITRRREGELHPDYKAAWDKRAHTLQLLIGNSNETLDRLAGHDVELKALVGRVAALEARPAVPFPASGPPTGGA